MTGKKKSKKGRKTQDEEKDPALPTDTTVGAACDNLASDVAIVTLGGGRVQHAESSSAAAPSDTSVPAVEVGQTASLLNSPRDGPVVLTSEPLSKLVDHPSDKEVATPSFVFSACQNSTCQGMGAPLSSEQPVGDSVTSTTLSATKAARSDRPNTRRRDIKCPPSERFGKLGNKSRHHRLLQLAAQTVAFGQGRDPLSLVVSYEESGLRRIVKAPDGCTSETIVDSTLRQAVAGTALESRGWQEALNHPREDSYFTYSTVPEGLTIAKFRDSKGKILVTPLSAESGLLMLKDEAEKKRKAAEEALENVKEYLQGLKSEDECSTEKSPKCAHCRNIQGQLDALLGLVKRPTPVELEKPVRNASILGNVR